MQHSWEEPTVRVLDGDVPLDVVSIDNLPSVLAEEASHAFADLLLPALLEYPSSRGWAEAERVRGVTPVACLATREGTGV